MKYPIYSHNSEVYIPVKVEPHLIQILKTGQVVITEGNRALFFVNEKNNGRSLSEMLNDKSPGYTIEGTMVLTPFEDDSDIHSEYVKQAVIESPQFSAGVKINFTNLSSINHGEILQAEFAVPLQHKFVHINPIPLKYV